MFAAKGLAQQILTFSKGGSPVKEKVDIGDLLKEYALFASRGASVRCDFDLPPDLKSIDDDEDYIRDITPKMLAHMGFWVTAVADGDAAIEAPPVFNYPFYFCSHYIIS